MAKTICWIQYTKNNRRRNKWQQRWESVAQINEQCCYGKTIENLRNRINVRLGSNKKDYLKWTSKPSYLSQKIFDNDLVAIPNSKVKLT